ncbi:eCIS core domain-containing protein [Demequina mangrovi]|uniref:L,D-transpeptidase catalytic domain n=1 Tax=Demequina mangrovi TaxID=1043493 RepID=A0A1H6U3R5_9MICO|nr:DUF4157 domain-containing protein [Demequina mangrovi]SEI82592.1 L,D-transpeptidase catalytic domain [Demequina mangrovi]
MPRALRRAPRPPATRTALLLDASHGAHERAAEEAAHRIGREGRLSGALSRMRPATSAQAPESVRSAVSEPGRPLHGDERAAWESRFGASLASVRLHEGAVAGRSAADVDAAAYAVGDHVVLGRDAPRAPTPAGRRLLAHELAHVVAASGDPAGAAVVQRYRRRGSFAFGERDTATLIEDSFNPVKDKATKPWIEKIEVFFTGTSTDAGGSLFDTGVAIVSYHASPVALPAFALAVSGGSGKMKTDPGTFTVHRIEGFGYNSGSASGTPGVDFQWSDREGPNKRYAKKDSGGFRAANMSFAVFYNKGEALHAGPLDFTSHGCVHVDWGNEDLIKQVNYHSVIGLTKVKVRYVGP